LGRVKPFSHHARVSDARKRRGRFRFQPSPEALEGRIVLTAYTFINQAGGAWEVATNWSPQGIPTNGDSVDIPALTGNAAVSYVGGAHLTGLTLDGTLDLGNGSLTVGTVVGTGTLTLNGFGGTLIGATVSKDITYSGGGTLDGVTLEGNETLTALTTVKNSLTLDGTIDLNNQLDSLGDQTTIGGSGTVNIEGTNTYNGILPDVNNGILTIGHGITVLAEGGFIGSGIAGTVVSQGTIEANGSNVQFGLYNVSIGTMGSLSLTGGAQALVPPFAYDTLTNAGFITIGEGSSIEGGGGGAYVQTATGALDVQIGSPPLPIGLQSPRINVGSENLAGTLTATYINGFQPTPGQIYWLIGFEPPDGTFGTVDGGDAIYSDTGVYLRITPTQAATTTTVISSANPSVFGQPVTFTATVMSTSTPTGSVDFQIDGGALVAGTAGSTTATTATWTFSTSALTVTGSPHTVQAFYVHTGNFTDSNGSLTDGQLVAEPGVDLSASIDSTKVYPEQAHDLRLNSVFGGEQLIVPVTVTNLGISTASGNAQISFYLSPTPTYDKATADPFQVGNLTNQTINLASYKAQTFTVTITVPRVHIPSRGTQIYILAILSSNISESDSNNGNDSNNVAATQSYDYLGIPSQYFDADTYFNIIRDTLNNTNPFENTGTSLSGPPATTDGLHFTAAFEIKGGYDNPDPAKLQPYLVPSGDNKPPHPTIGIGLDLVTGLDKTIKKDLAADVRAYYLAHYHTDLSKMSDDQIIDMLKKQAQPNGGAKQALTAQNAQDLYKLTYDKAQNRAIKFVGQNAWNNLSSTARIVLTDIAFNGIGGFKNLKTDLQAPVIDYVLAGFDVIDSFRTAQQVQYDRSLADYEYLLYGFTTKLGSISS